MDESLGNLRKWLLPAVGFALIAVALLLQLSDYPVALLWIALYGFGWLALAVANRAATPFQRALRTVQFGIAALTMMAFCSRLLSIESPFSEMRTNQLEGVVAISLLVMALTVLVRGLLQPTSDDFKMIDAANKEARRVRKNMRDSNGVSS